MIIEDVSMFDIDLHEVADRRTKDVDYLIYVNIGQKRYLTNDCDEDVLMIYSNIVNHKIYIDPKVAENDRSFREYVEKHKDKIPCPLKVLGYDKEEFEKKYFLVLL